MQTIVNEYKLECYRKITPIGTKGNLWIVEDSVTQNRYVMRKLPMDLQEVYQKLATIHNTNIVEVIDIFSCDGCLYIIEEYLKWELLSDVIDTRKLSHRQVLSIGRQLFHALFVLHEHNIVHRDIKPENIMMDIYGNVKLIDFDIARLFTEDKSEDTTVKGSKDYAPPEQFGFSQTDRRADIYSLGVTLNELAVGKLPEYKMCTGKLGTVIKRCTEFDPKRRYQNAAQALKHINLLEKRTTLLILSVILFFLLIAVKTFLFLDKWQENKEQTFTRTNRFARIDIDAQNVSENETLFEMTEFQDRIIYAKHPEQYPAFLMTEDKEYDFSVNLDDNLIMFATANKNSEQMFLDCTLSDGSNAVFQFYDVCSDIYKEQGHINDIDFEKTSPEYEILLDDIDEDGITDLLVTLAWRCRVDTPDPKDRFYFTEYSTLWVVYITEDNELICSEPLYFNGCEPSLQTNSIIYDYGCTEWYTFYNGTWD